MKLNHLNLTVTDALETGNFLVKHFGFRLMEGAPQSSAFCLVLDDDQFVLTLMRGKRGEPVSYPPNFHIGFCFDQQAKVDEIHRLLREDGIEVPEPGVFHGSYTFYFNAPGGVTIEVQSFIRN